MIYVIFEKYDRSFVRQGEQIQKSNLGYYMMSQEAE